MRPFWRENNIWRLVGLVIAMVGCALAIVIPDITVYESGGFKISLGVVVMILGFLGFYPTLKEALAKKASK